MPDLLGNPTPCRGNRPYCPLGSRVNSSRGAQFSELDRSHAERSFHAHRVSDA